MSAPSWPRRYGKKACESAGTTRPWTGATPTAGPSETRPTWPRCKMQEELRALLSRYGRINLLWFDADGNPAPWNQERTYRLVRGLQTEIIINYGIPYFPNVSLGWDSSPRANQADEFGNFGYPFTNTISGNTPERFREALEIAHGRLLAQKSGPRILTVNSWNEWTEGSYIEPDAAHGLNYLEAIRDVFG